MTIAASVAPRRSTAIGAAVGQSRLTSSIFELCSQQRRDKIGWQIAGWRIGMPAMRKIWLAGAAAALIAGPLLAAARDNVDARVAGLRQLGAAFKNINDELRSDTPQAMILQLSARQIRDAARAQYGWFPAGSGPESGVKTAARAEIWAQPAQFKAAQDAFAIQAAAFMKVAATGDAAAMRVQARQLGASCAACHKSFRVDDRH